MSTQNKSAGYYFVVLHHSTKIDPEARIQWALSKPEMLERMQDCYRTEIVDAVPGHFGDCYAKTVGKPDLEALALDIPLGDADDFIVRGPGTHPGGRMYWIDFAHTVYVPVEKADEE
jgi:hypothetical protein